MAPTRGGPHAIRDRGQAGAGAALARAGEWRDETFFDILERAGAKRIPTARCSSTAESRITYGELKDKVERCAAFLRAIGIERGDVVTIQLPNRIAFPIVFFALELIGAIANKVNPDFRVRELDYILRFSGSRAFVCPASFKGFDYVGMARQLREAIPALDARRRGGRRRRRRVEPRARASPRRRRCAPQTACA